MKTAGVATRGDSVTEFQPKREDYDDAVRALHARTGLAGSTGVELISVAPGQVTAEMKLTPDLTQQHGVAHAGAIASLADIACGLAAYSLMPVGSSVVSININLSLMRPAAGERLRAVGRVVKAGERIYFTEAELFVGDDLETKPVARVSATMTSVRGD